jgi:ribonuclease PH
MTTPDDDITDNKILEFKPRPEHESPIERKSNWFEHKHGRLLIDFENRVILCRLCGQSIGPWAALLAIQESFSEITYKYKAVKEHEEKSRAEAKKRQEKWQKKNEERRKGGAML